MFQIELQRCSTGCRLAAATVAEPGLLKLRSAIKVAKVASKRGLARTEVCLRNDLMRYFNKVVVYPRLATALLGALIFLGASPEGSAQSSRATVTGQVIDSSKAEVAGASVDLANEATKVVRSTRSNESGVYVFDAVDPGTYRIKVNSPGFSALETQPFTVVASQVAKVDAQMEIGQVTNVVEVSAESTLIQTEAPVRGGTISAQSVIALPIPTQNPVMLTLTLPGVSTNRYSFGIDTFSVNGARGRSNNFMLDGTENNDISVAGQAFQIKNPDAIQEISVQTSNFDAEYGRAGGALINVITMSGTNRLHGSARYLLESNIFKAPTNLMNLSPAVRKRGHPLP